MISLNMGLERFVRFPAGWDKDLCLVAADHPQEDIFLSKKTAQNWLLRGNEVCSSTPLLENHVHFLLDILTFPLLSHYLMSFTKTYFFYLCESSGQRLFPL